MREWLIHKLGGFVPKDYAFEIEEVEAEDLIVDDNIDDDDIEYAQVQIARKIGEKMLDLGLIRFNFTGYQSTDNKYTSLNGKVMSIRQNN